MSAPLLEIANLRMRYPNGREVLRAVSLSIAGGECAVVLGSNGSGKSTMLRCVVRLLTPVEGRILVAGRDLATLSGAELRAARRPVAMVFQQAHLVRRRSAVANVVAGSLGRRRDLRTALGFLPSDEMPAALRHLATVGLTSVAEQRASTLSGGQAQRVAIARALAQEPRVLLADEPVASLDPEAAEEVMRLLACLAHEQGLAVLCVLHQPDLALRHADRIIGLRNGSVAFDKPSSRVESDAINALYVGEAA